MIACTLGAHDEPFADDDEETKGPGTRAKAAAMLRQELIAAQDWLAKRDAPEGESGEKDGKPGRDLRKEAFARVLKREIPLLVTAHRHQDIATALHRDGTITTLRHVITQLHGAEHLAAWDETVRSYDARRERHQILEARLLTPENSWINAERHTHTVSAPGPRANRNGRTIVVRFSPLRPGVIVEFEELYDSFQVDEFDDFNQAGWSVLVRGIARYVGPEELPKYVSDLPTPWPAGERSTYVRITPTAITGRRLLAS